MTLTRRTMLAGLALLPALAWAEPDAAPLKAAYRERLKKMLAGGRLAYIDIESSCNSSHVDIGSVARSMDQLGIGLMALSADIGWGQFRSGVRYDNLSERLLASHPDRFIPVGNGGQPPTLTDAPYEFLDAQEAAARKRQILLLGEFEFRHYPSPRQVRRGELGRDVAVAIDGPVGHRVFGLSEALAMPFQLHYEIENDLLGPLEAMLARYPNAKVIWCHFAQIRYIERASRYTPAYVDGLMSRFPNLYFDTAFGDSSSVYPVNQQRHARVWATTGDLKPEWRDLIAAHPKRFLSALDLGGDRLDQIVAYDQKHRDFLRRLPAETQAHVAYRSAWSLLFGEEFA